MHLIHLALDLLDELELGAAPVQIVVGPVNFVIDVPLQVIHQKTDTLFQRDEFRRKGQIVQLGGSQKSRASSR